MMHLKSLLLTSVLTLAGSSLLISCQDKSTSQNSQIICTETAISVLCILETADKSLQAVGNSFDYVSAAGELAVAYAASGHADKASTLIEQAITKSDAIEDEKKLAAGLTELVTAISDIKAHSGAMGWLENIKQKSENLPAASQADIAAKSIIAQAVHGNPTAALSAAINLPQIEDYEANYKAVTLRKIADILAKNGDFESARTAIDAISMSIIYYQSLVRSDVARAAAKKGKNDFAHQLLAEADLIARAQDNGYFIGAALRDIGYSFHIMRETEKADSYFKEALIATADASKQNEKARSTSRVATRMSDAGLSDRTPPILADSVAFAKDIPSGLMQGYSYYEIAGSAAFSGQFELAQSLVDKVPDNPLGATTSMKSAAERDLAWGYARHGQIEKALSTANGIAAPREKIHALSRIVRLLNNPMMPTLPRYL